MTSNDPSVQRRLVAVNGARSALGRRIVAELRRGLGGGGWDASSGGVDTVAVERPASLADPATELSGVTHLVVLASTAHEDTDGSTVGGVDLEGARRLLAAAADVPTLVQVLVVSSAMVYGAWADNPVPLSEASVLRPVPGCRFAVAKAELERLAASLQRRRRDLLVTVLRPTLVVSDDVDSVDWLERSLWTSAALSTRSPDLPRQFLMLDDLVSAVVTVLRHPERGAFNVAPDGWITEERQRELAGSAGTPALPAPTAGWVARVRWKLGVISTPPDVLPYVRAPWVVANDRLRSKGWTPSHTNDEAFTSGSRGTWWSTLTARRRQDVALGALALTVGGIAFGVVALLRRTLGRPDT